MGKIAFVYGGAKTLQDDIDAAHALCKPDTIIACNDAGMEYEGVLPHFCTLHTELVPQWLEDRRSKCLPDPLNFWTSNVKTIPECHAGLYKQVPPWGGSSGLLCVTVAMHLGYDKIILCGVPLDRRAEHYNYPGEWMDATRYRSAWTKHKGLMMGKVRSFQGWTAAIIGEPTKEWLDYDQG
jgi:hypothetical protein